MNPAKRRALLRNAPRAQSDADHRAGIHHAVRTADRRAAVGASNRRGRQQGHAQAVPGGRYTGQDAGAGRGRPDRLHQDHRPVPHQVQAHPADLPHPARPVRRPGPARPRRAGSLAGRGPQDRQRCTEHGLRRADHRGRHAHLPRCQPHGARAGQERAGSRAEAAEGGAGGIPPGCAPLADPARALRVQGTQAGMLALRDRAAVRVQAEDAGRRRNEKTGTSSPRFSVRDPADRSSISGSCRLLRTTGAGCADAASRCRHSRGS